MAKKQYTGPPHFQGTYALPQGPQSARGKQRPCQRERRCTNGGFMWLRHYHLAWPVLALSFTACERTQPLAPVLEASTAAPGPTVNAPSNLGAAAVDTARINPS